MRDGRMQKRGFWYRLVSLSLVLVVSLGVWLFPTHSASAFTEDQKVFLQAWRIVNQAYIDDTFNGQNWWLMRQKYLRKPFEDREEAYQAIEEMLGTLEDPFTRLLRPDQYRSLKVSTSGELSGVGLQIDLDPNNGRLEVVAPIAGSPAESAGVKAGDYILAIDGVNTEKMPLDEAAVRMRGQVGTEVSLTVEHRKTQKQETVTIVRDRIALNPVYAKLDTEHSENPIGYVRLSQFSANANQELTKAVDKLSRKGAKGYILDLRNNPGGLLQAGVEVARLWLNDSTIVYTVNRQGMLGSFDAGHAALTDAPLVVLVNQGSASASEILAGALQDNGRAKLVGQTTFGKGLIQSLFELSDDAGIAVTVAKYETPDHRDIHKLGITPDYSIEQEPITLSQVGTEADLQYIKAVKALMGNG